MDQILTALLQIFGFCRPKMKLLLKTYFMEEPDGLSLTFKGQVEVFQLFCETQNSLYLSAAFYRVNYEAGLWLELENALKSENFDGIDVISRTLIVDDVFNLARSSQLPYATALDIVSYLVQETEYYPWHAAFTNFNFLRRRIGQHGLLEAFLTVRTDLFLHDLIIETSQTDEMKDRFQHINIVL